MTNLPWRVDPCEMTEVGVSRCTNHCCLNRLELSDAVTECDDLSWTHKGAVNTAVEPLMEECVCTNNTLKENKIMYLPSLICQCEFTTY